MDETGDDIIREDELDRITQLLEVLTKKIERLEIAMTEEDHDTATNQKFVSLGDEIFAPEAPHKKGKKRRQSTELKLLRVRELLIDILS
jgi:hypothetical protein